MSIDNNISLANHENYSEHDQYLEGTGLWEKKGGIAIVISALQGLRFVRQLKKHKIGILLTTDSSIDGKYARSIIRQKADLAKRILSVSGSSKNGGLVISRSGSATYQYESKLIDTQLSENISTMATQFNRTLATISDISRNDPDNLIAPYNIQFSSNIFRESAHGSAGISVRFNSQCQLEAIETKLKKIIVAQKRFKIYQVQFEGGIKRPAMEASEASEQWYEQIHDLAQRVDIRVTKKHRWSSADICHISKQMPKIDGLGPVGEFLPSQNERILRHSLVERALLLALVLIK